MTQGVTRKKPTSLVERPKDIRKYDKKVLLELIGQHYQSAELTLLKAGVPIPKGKAFQHEENDNFSLLNFGVSIDEFIKFVKSCPEFKGVVVTIENEGYFESPNKGILVVG